MTRNRYVSAHTCADGIQLRPTIMSKADKIKMPKAGDGAPEDSSDQTSSAEEDETASMGKLKIKNKHPTLRPPRTLETTLFQRLEALYGPGIKRVLQVQYR